MGPSEFRFPFFIQAFLLFLKVYANLPNETDSASTPSMEFGISTPRTMCGGVVADEHEGWHVIYNTNSSEIQVQFIYLYAIYLLFSRTCQFKFQIIIYLKQFIRIWASNFAMA